MYSIVDHTCITLYLINRVEVESWFVLCNGNTDRCIIKILLQVSLHFRFVILGKTKLHQTLITFGTLEDISEPAKFPCTGKGKYSILLAGFPYSQFTLNPTLTYTSKRGLLMFLKSYLLLCLYVCYYVHVYTTILYIVIWEIFVVWKFLQLPMTMKIKHTKYFQHK